MEKNSFHILVVDDDDKIRELIKQFLVEKGFIISTAINAEDAKSKIETFNFNLVILDVMMPGQSGFDLTKELINKPISEVTFKLSSIDQLNEISKFLPENGETIIKINIQDKKEDLFFVLENRRNIDRKTINLLRNKQISAIIN